MINLHERILPTPAGVEPATSWSPVGRASNCATEAGAIRKLDLHVLFQTKAVIGTAFLKLCVSSCENKAIADNFSKVSIHVFIYVPLFIESTCK